MSQQEEQVQAAAETIQKHERHRSAMEEVSARRSRSNSPVNSGTTVRRREEDEPDGPLSPKEQAVASIQSHQRARAAKKTVEVQRSRSSSPIAKATSSVQAAHRRNAAREEIEKKKQERAQNSDSSGSGDEKRQNAIQLLQNRSRMTLAQQQVADDQAETLDESRSSSDDGAEDRHGGSEEDEKRQGAIQLLQNRSRMTLAQQEVAQKQSEFEEEEDEEEEELPLLGNETFELTISLVKATGLRDADDSFFASGKSDPYVKVLSSSLDRGHFTSPKTIFTSSIVEDKCNPVWDPAEERFSLPSQPTTRKSLVFPIEVMEDDVGKDDHLGYGRLIINDCRSTTLGEPKEIKDKVLKVPIFTIPAVEEEYYKEEARDRLIHEVPEFCGWVEFMVSITFRGESHDEYVAARRAESALLMQNLLRGKEASESVSKQRDKVKDERTKKSTHETDSERRSPSAVGEGEVEEDSKDQGVGPRGSDEEEEEHEKPRFHVRHRVELSLLRASDLKDADSGLFNGKSDPYVKVFHDGALIHTSAVIEDKLNPVWDPKKETFVVVDTIKGLTDDDSGGSRVIYLPLASRVVTLFVEVWEADIAGTEEFLGCGTLSIDVDVPSEAVVQARAPELTKTKKEDEHELTLQSKDFTAGSIRRKKSTTIGSPTVNSKRASRATSFTGEEDPSCGHVFFASRVSTVTKLLETASEAEKRTAPPTEDLTTPKRKKSVKTTEQQEVRNQEEDNEEDPYANVLDPRDKALPSYLTSVDDQFSPNSSKKKVAGGVPTAMLPPLEARYLKTGPKLDAQRDQSKRRKEAAEVKFRLQRMFRDLDRVDMSFQYLESQGESDRKLKPITTKERKRWANKVDILRSEMRKGGTGFTGIGSNAEKKKKRQSVSPQRRRNHQTAPVHASTPDPTPTKLPPLRRTQ